LEFGTDEVVVAHDGFARLPGVGRATRRWHFDGAAVIVEDEIAGSGRHNIVRRLHTTLPARRLKLRGDGEMRAEDAMCWVAYGESVPATRIEFRARMKLPARLRLEIGA
jgi:hypothetical protein